jgi:hypothetical protein
MDLPKGLRFMVYERLPRQIKHVELFACSETMRLVTPDCILVTKFLSIAILRTCREVHAEANAIVQKLAQDFILLVEPKIIKGHFFGHGFSEVMHHI